MAWETYALYFPAAGQKQFTPGRSGIIKSVCFAAYDNLASENIAFCSREPNTTVGDGSLNTNFLFIAMPFTMPNQQSSSIQLNLEVPVLANETLFLNATGSGQLVIYFEPDQTPAIP